MNMGGGGWGGDGRGGFSSPSITFKFIKLIKTKLRTVIELCIFYPKTKDLFLLMYTNEFFKMKSRTLA